MAVTSAVVCMGACLGVVSMEAGWGTVRQRLLVKTVASVAMVVFALVMGAAQSTAGMCFVAGLLLSTVGDALLARSEEDFVRGLVAFLVAHLAYIMGFMVSGADVLGMGFSAVLLLPVSLAVWLRLAPHAGRLKKPVAAYLLVISTMLLAAAGSVWAEPSWAHQLLLLSAVGFAISDIFVAEKRLRTAHWSQVAVGLPLYYLSQLGIGLGASGL